MLANASKLDVVFRKLLLAKFFTKGWGSVDNLKRMCEFGRVISDRSHCKHLVDKTYPVYIDKNEQKGECRVLEGHFLSPFAKYMKGIMPKEVETARFQVILPLTWKSETKPICIHLAGTGDHRFWRRRTIMARPLLKEYGIASIILENPFYGLRKPKEQLRSSLLNVNDLFVMGGALILETLTLLHWCEKQGYGPLGISGVSMGGHMATLAATNWHKPIALIPCLSWSNATPTFTEGVMSGAISWETLASEYVFHSEYEAEILRKLMKCPQYDAYKLGQEFAANFPESMEELKHVTLKSGLGSSHQEQPKAEPLSASIPFQEIERDTQSSGVSQQSSQCNVADSSVPSDTDIRQTQSIVAHSDRYQNDSIPKTNNSSSSLSSFIGIGQCETTHALLEAKDSISPDAEKQKINGHLFNGMHTQSRDCTSNSQEGMSVDTCHPHSHAESSEMNTSRLNINQSFSNSEAVQGTSRRVDRNKHGDNSGHSIGINEQRSNTKASVKVERSRTISSHSKDKNLKGKTKWKLSKEEYAAVKEDALHFMEGVMDAATFVGNFSKPVDPELVLSILAKQDAYIPWYQMPSLEELWPGMEVRFVNSGHVAAILFKQHHFRRAINDTFQKMERKYRGVFPEET